MTITSPMEKEIQSQIDQIEHTTPGKEQWHQTAQLASYLTQKHLDLYTLNVPAEYQGLHQKMHHQLASITQTTLKAESFYLEGKLDQAEAQLQSLLDQYHDVEQTTHTILTK
ncbi:hypothetical protein [Desmospora activa]|uniref:Uncharacterized protein n=1 Tax=Desmospora activa DSM 45169 TaxID=1121389 RepID=A0A2T4Z7T4_9BACL|nr:hypothetical protein [Desmospora activa]PTM57929.1 hypothetical protein C8J48_0497 [Desmospora activa DSM 45169]